MYVHVRTSGINSFGMPSGSSALNRTAVSLPIQDIILIRDTIGPKGHPVETFALTATVKRIAYQCAVAIKATLLLRTGGNGL